MEQTRFNMVEQQIRPWDVLDANVLDLLIKMKREQFVPAEHHALALMDVAIPLGEGVQMWEPKLEARAVQALKLQSTDSVLEIGTGSGYVTALLASLAADVTSVEILPTLSAKAEHKLALHHFSNVTCAVGDGARGWGESQYDAILLGASVPLPPSELLSQLKEGGRLFAVVGDAPAMHACIVTRTASGFETKVLFETCVSPLQNVQQPQRFVF
jgi:protein-L-isoaspartate(D-aspartate) O-methyltransferase